MRALSMGPNRRVRKSDQWILLASLTPVFAHTASAQAKKQEIYEEFGIGSWLQWSRSAYGDGRTGVAGEGAGGHPVIGQGLPDCDPQNICLRRAVHPGAKNPTTGYQPAHPDSHAAVTA